MVVSIGLLFLAVPRLTRAMPPPGGIKFCLFTGVCDPTIPQESKVKEVKVFFHGAGVVDPSCSQLENISSDDYQPWNTVGGPMPSVSTGGSVGLSMLVWLKDGKSLQAANGDITGVNLWMQYPISNVGTSFTTDIFGGGANYVCSKINGSQTVPNFWASKPDDGNGWGNSSGGQQAIEAGTSGPDLIFSLVFNNVMPNLQQETTFNTQGGLYFRANWPSESSYTPLDGRSTSINVRPQAQSVDIHTGDVAIKNGFGDNRIILNNQGGQTVITDRQLNNCDWSSPALHQKCLDSDGVKKYVGLYLTNLFSTANLDQAKTELKKTLSKVAQETAEIYNSNDQNQINQHINDFLRRNYNPWLHPRGEVLIIGGDLSNLDVKSLTGRNFEVRGRKLLVFSSSTRGFQVNWKDYVGYANDSGPNKLASISLSGSQVLEGNPNLADSDPRFDGAFIATSLSGRTDNRITIGGGPDYPPVTINGLIMADQIAVTRQVNPANPTIATINYDPSFQNGGLLGLSPFIRPLVSEGGSQ